MNKLLKIQLVLALIFAAACSDDESNSNPNGDLANAKLSFAGSTSIVEVPEGLASASDSVAKETYSFVQLANEMTGLIGNFSPPPGATTSSKRIVPANGRVKDGEYLVYTWEDSGFTFVYQLSQTSDSYAFEILLKEIDSAEFLRVIYAEEKKDQSEGFLRFYGAGSESDAALALYEWKREGGVFSLTVTYNIGGFKMEIVINADKSGSMKTFEAKELVYEIEWDSEGNGSWTLYAGGEVDSSGEWTV